MAVNVSVFDLDNFPSNPKTVSVDLTELVPLGNGGEDTWVFSATTTATASGSVAIQRLYISDIKFGWAKSSGLKTGPYAVTGGQKHLKVAIDETIAGAVEIALEQSISLLGGDTIAQDIQEKISATAKTGGAKAGNIAYLNASCTYTNGIFEIVSGTAGRFYTGSNKTSVDVADGATTTGLAAELGFNISFKSEDIASNPPGRVGLSSDYTSGTTLLVTAAGIVSEGDCVTVTDGVNREYRGVESSNGTMVTLSSGLANTYGTGSLVQVMRFQDPTGQPSPAYSSIDDFIKFALSTIVNQIDFSK